MVQLVDFVLIYTLFLLENTLNIILGENLKLFKKLSRSIELWIGEEVKCRRRD